MNKDRAELWHEGFKADELLGGRCPYPEGSREALAWEAGWAEGVMKRTGDDYRNEPPSNAWEKLLKWLRLKRR